MSLLSAPEGWRGVCRRGVVRYVLRTVGRSSLSRFKQFQHMLALSFQCGFIEQKLTSTGSIRG